MIYILGILGTAYIVIWIEQVRPSDLGFYRNIYQKEEVLDRRKEYPFRAKDTALSERERKIARTAWSYFERNYVDSTGFVNSVDKYPATTLWDLSSSLHALLSAHNLGLIDRSVMDRRLTRCFKSFLEMPLYQGKLPNKVYNTRKLKMVDYDNRITQEGVGWSALDIGRFFSVCARIVNHYPAHTDLVKKVIDRWDTAPLVQEGQLYGIGFSYRDGDASVVQEGKLGYEEYAAKGYRELGFDVSRALRYLDFYKIVETHGVEVLVDSREVKEHPAYNYVLSAPYILDQIEYGGDRTSKELAHRVFRAQKKRSKIKDRLIAVSETHIDTAPYFVYNCLYVNGELWNCIAEDGSDADRFRSLSTSAAFGWSYVYDTPYSERLREGVRSLYKKGNGFYSGRYQKQKGINKALTANVNAMILECLDYHLNGPLVPIHRK
ncbi:MAG: DUF3131 domain-containing protein [Flavobacteriales bacterium]